MAHLPQALRLADLSPREQFAAAELFRGTMVRHSAIVYRDDRPGSFQPISFAGNAWLSYVPIRMPETICVQDRPPATVLINQNHTFTDLVMTIDTTEKRIFDAIDGNRSIAGILELTLPPSLGQGQMRRSRLLRTALVARSGGIRRITVLSRDTRIGHVLIKSIHNF